MANRNCVGDIYIINLNPAYDIHYRVDGFDPYGESYGKLESRNIGGKGVNVALALKAAGVTAKCVTAVGYENCAEFKAELINSGVDCVFIDRPGRIRENITIHKSGFHDTRVSLDSFFADASLLGEVKSLISPKKGDYVLFCGRLPEGISINDATAFLVSMRESGAEIVLDSNSLDLDCIRKIRPWLIKPNEAELSALASQLENDESKVSPVEMSAENAAVTARRIATSDNASCINNILVSLGSKGAVLVTLNKAYFCKAAKINPKSTVGAGDSAVAGFMYSVVKGKGFTDADCLLYSCAFGSAACLREGTNPPDLSEIIRLYGLMKAETL